MKLVTNSVSPTQVRETDNKYIIEDVPFVKSMELSGGYVPEKSIKQTADEWAGVPTTLKHPRDSNGKPVAASTKPETHIGTVTNPRFDGEFVRANIEIDKADLQSVDAKPIKDQLESEQPISVSSQYAADELPPGEYDGEYRSNVEQITRPDSVAILPRGPGVCDIEDGCGINPSMVANAAVTIPMQANKQHFKPGDLVEWQNGDATAQGRVLEAFTDPDEQESVTRTFEGTEITRKVTEDEGAFLVEAWNPDTEEFDSDKQALKSGSQVSAWENPPEAAESMAANTDDGVEASEGMADTMQSNQIEFALTDVTPDDVDSYTDDEWDGDAATAAMPNPSESDEAASALDAAHLIHPTTEENRDAKENWKLPFRTGPDAPVNTRALVAAIAAINGARGGVDAPQEDLDGAEARAKDFLVDAPSDLFGSMDSEDEDIEGGTTHSEDMSDNMSERTAELVANHGFNPENLPSEQTACFDRIYKAVTANAKGEQGEGTMEEAQRLISELTDAGMTQAAIASEVNRDPSTISDIVNGDIENPPESLLEELRDVEPPENETMSDNSKVGLDDLTDEAKEALVDKAAEQIEANRQESEKENLAEDIVANSNEYDDTESVREDYPTVEALETKKSQVTTTAGMPTAGATRSGIEANSGEAEYPDMDIGTRGDI